MYAFAEAQLQLERVLGLWEQVPDAEERAGMDRVGLLSRCAEAAYAAGDPVRAAELVRQALALVDGRASRSGPGCSTSSSPATCACSATLTRSASSSRRCGWCRPSRRRSGRGCSARSRTCWWWCPASEEARGLAEEAVAIAGQVGARAEEANARTALGGALVYLGDADAGLAELAAAVRLATEADEVIVALRAILNHSDGLLAAGRLEEAATVALDGIGRPAAWAWPASTGRCWPTTPPRRWSPWAAGTRPSRSPARAWRPPRRMPPRYLLLARAALELGRGDLDAAEARLQAVRRLLPASIPEAQGAGPLFAGLAELALWRGDLDQARQLVAEAVPLVEANPRHAAPLYALGLRVEADRAELARARHPGQPAPDDATATTLLERLDQAATGPAAAGLPELAAWHATGLAERTRQQGPSDPAAWAAAAAAWERLGQPYRAAYAGFRQAEALLASRRPRHRRGGAGPRRRHHRPPRRPPPRRRGPGPGPARPPGPGPARRCPRRGGRPADTRRSSWA